MSFLDTLSPQRCPKSAYKHELFLFIICIIICTCLQISSYIGNHCLCLYVNKWTVSVLFSNQIASSTTGSEKPLSVQLLFSTHMKKPQWRYLQRMASVYVNSWQILGGDIHVQLWPKMVPGESTMDIWFPSHHPKSTGNMEVYSLKAQEPRKKIQVVLNWMTRACCSMLLIHSTTWRLSAGVLSCTYTGIFSPSKKEIPKGVGETHSK